jgi:hypothetical protein
LERKQSGFVLHADNALVEYLTQLHALATELASDNTSIALHVTAGTTKDSACDATRKHRAAVLKKMETCLGTMKLLLPLSSDPAVQIVTLPSIKCITGPEALPSSLGGTVTINGAGDMQLTRLLSAYNERRAAADELDHVNTDLSRVPDNINAVIIELSAMLSALCSETPDLVRGAGASGLMRGPPDALFDVSRMFNANDGAVANQAMRSEVAAGMASLVREGLELWEEQRRQISVLRNGILALSARQLGRPYLVLKQDRSQRAHALRFATDLFSRKLSPEDWAAKSVDPGCDVSSAVSVSLAEGLASNSVAPVIALSAACNTSESIDLDALGELDDDTGSDDEVDLLDGEQHDRSEQAEQMIWDDDEVVALCVSDNDLLSATSVAGVATVSDEDTASSQRYSKRKRHQNQT